MNVNVNVSIFVPFRSMAVIEYFWNRHNDTFFHYVENEWKIPIFKTKHNSILCSVIKLKAIILIVQINGRKSHSQEIRNETILQNEKKNKLKGQTNTQNHFHLTLILLMVPFYILERFLLKPFRRKYFSQ